MPITAAKQAILQGLQHDMGLDFPPESFLHFSPDPERLRELWHQFREHLLQGALPRLTKEMIFIVVSTSNQCEYCTTVHSAFARNLGLPKQILGSLSGSLKYLEPPELKALMIFCRNIAVNEQTIDAERQQLLQLSRYSDDEINDAIRMVAFACMMTRLANNLMMEEHIDKGFLDLLAK